jgi:hypothetical protein
VHMRVISLAIFRVSSWLFLHSPTHPMKFCALPISTNLGLWFVPQVLENRDNIN